MLACKTGPVALSGSLTCDLSRSDGKKGHTSEKRNGVSVPSLCWKDGERVEGVAGLSNVEKEIRERSKEAKPSVRSIMATVTSAQEIKEGPKTKVGTKERYSGPDRQGWRENSVPQSICRSDTGPRFSSQHPHCGSTQPPLIQYQGL